MSTIKSSSEDLTLNADGTGRDIKFQSNGSEVGSLTAEGVLTATSFAGSGASLTGIAGGDKRNFITDGDFTQWIGATSATAVTHGSYTNHALTQYRGQNDGTSTIERSTDTPTVAESSHESKYSLLMKCTGTDSSITTNQGNRLYHYITGTDYSSLHRQEFTISFWAKTAGANTGDTYYLALQNSADAESYVKSFTATSSWAKYTFTIPASNAGTWLFTEADVGLKVIIVLASGDTNDDGTDGSWVTANEYWAAGTAISNFMDSTSNEFYLSQFQLTLGSTAPTFTSPPIATVRDQVSYYIEHWDYSNGGNQYIATGGFFRSSTHQTCVFHFKPKRVSPTCTSTNSDTFECIGVTGALVPSSGTPAWAFHTKNSVRFSIDTFTGASNGGCTVQRNATDTCNITLDARH